MFQSSGRTVPGLAFGSIKILAHADEYLALALWSPLFVSLLRIFSVGCDMSKWLE